MLMFSTLRMQILAAVSLVLPLLAQPALAQSHIRGTLAGVKDDTITVQALNGGNEDIKLAGDVARVTHWINVLCLALLLMSGLQIFNAHPALYWGATSKFGDPAFVITTKKDGNGETRGGARPVRWPMPTS